MNWLSKIMWYITVIPLPLCGLYSPSIEAQSNYFVSSSGGDDSNSGLTPKASWASLDRVNLASLNPGDSVQFKSGDTFYGQLIIDESGTAERPILFTSYGSDGPAVIDGATRSNGDNVSAISVINQDHIEISHLTITNFRKQGRQTSNSSNKGTSDSVSLTVRARGAKSVRLHSNLFNWNPKHPKGRAFSNGDGSWSVIIEPSGNGTSRYKWIVDGVKENLDNDVTRGRCRARLADGSVISGANFTHRVWNLRNGDITNDVAGNCKSADGNKVKANPSDLDAYGILVKNTGRRTLQGFEFHHLTVEKIYPIRAKSKFKEQAFVENTVTGIRFETLPAKSKNNAFNTRDIFLHDNLIRETGRFGIAARHRASNIKGVTGTSLDYDVNFIVLNNRCENLGGSCVLMSGVWQGLLEGNSFIRSGSMVEPSVSVNRGSGAWFFRSKHVVAQNNVAAFSRGHNDSAGIHVDYNNENILVQYNFTYDNEGYGTEILGSNKNIIWRYNLSVGDGTRKVNVARPEGGQSQHPGRTLHISDFAKPNRAPSSDLFIYNNTYLISSGSTPNINLTAGNLLLKNNLFIVEDKAKLGQRVNIDKSWLSDFNIANNGFSGNVSSSLTKIDISPILLKLSIEGEISNADSFAFDYQNVKLTTIGQAIDHPDFPAAGSGIFTHISREPTTDFFGNLISKKHSFIGAGVAAESMHEPARFNLSTSES
ncbi:MAG: hypothetical protein P8H89_01245 [Porticoccaceae bacterium]|nr:hypothetical protein [Porticoccaceae bacterium]